MVTVAAILLIAALLIRDMIAPNKFIIDDEGLVTGIVKNSKQSGEEFKLELTMRNGKDTAERTVTIRSRLRSDVENDSTLSDEELSNAQRDAELSGKITDMEYSTKRRIVLPSKLSDGTILSWRIPKEQGDDAIWIVLIYVFFMALIIKSALDATIDNMAARRKIILKSLPRFTNQLLMMMNAGIILSDAFSNICSNYSMLAEDERNFFERDMIEIEKNNVNHRDSTAKLLTNYASKYNIKEMMRIATILTENERRGSDVLESLERESEFLWENRKITAAERGKALDAKMAYPLGLLLIILIVITIAPAFLSM